MLRPRDAGGKPGYCRKREKKERNFIYPSQEPKKRTQGYKAAIPMDRGRPSIRFGAPNWPTASRSSEISLKRRLDGDVRDGVENTSYLIASHRRPTLGVREYNSRVCG